MFRVLTWALVLGAMLPTTTCRGLRFCKGVRMSTRAQIRWLLMLTALAVLILVLASDVAAEGPWQDGHGSGYGAESIWDGGYWSNEQWRWIGYYGARTSWGHHCALPEHFNPDSPYFSWAVLTPASVGVAHRSFARLGTQVRMRIPRVDGTIATVTVPITDAGPFGVWWSWDLQDGLVRQLGWAAVAPSRYAGREGPYFGRRDIQWQSTWIRQYCPRWGPGFAIEPAAG